MRGSALVTLVAIVGGTLLGSLLASSARADIGLLSVRPAKARIGQAVEVRSDAYKPFAPMPLYLVPKAKAPKPFPCGPKTQGESQPASASL